MLVSKAARRYAAALLQTATDDGATEKVLNDANLIKDTVLGSRELSQMLRSPVVKTDDKHAVLKALFEGKVQKRTFEVIELVTRKKREALLADIAQAYIEAYNIAAGIVEVEVMSASKLGSAQSKALQKSLETRLSKKVNLTQTVDESLRGGIAVKIGDTIIDGTVKHGLDRLERQLLDSAVETN